MPYCPRLEVGRSYPGDPRQGMRIFTTWSWKKSTVAPGLYVTPRNRIKNWIATTFFQNYTHCFLNQLKLNWTLFLKEVPSLWTGLRLVSRESLLAIGIGETCYGDIYPGRKFISFLSFWDRGLGRTTPQFLTWRDSKFTTHGKWLRFLSSFITL